MNEESHQVINPRKDSLALDLNLPSMARDRSISHTFGLNLNAIKALTNATKDIN
jgi:hypothetical protein